MLSYNIDYINDIFEIFQKLFVDMLQIVIFKYISDTVIINYNVMKQSYILFVIIYIGNQDNVYISNQAPLAHYNNFITMREPRTRGIYKFM